MLADPFADRLTVPQLGENGDIYQRVLGWDDLGEEVGTLAKSNGAASVAVARRWEESALNYYLRGDLPVYIWASGPRPANHFEMVYPLTADVAQPILFLATCDKVAGLDRTFASVADLGRLEIETGPTSARIYHAFLLAGLHGRLGPPPACTP